MSANSSRRSTNQRCLFKRRQTVDTKERPTRAPFETGSNFLLFGRKQNETIALPPDRHFWFLDLETPASLIESLPFINAPITRSKPTAKSGSFRPQFKA